jgi:hypothetical protein
VYIICIQSAADLGIARRERTRIDRRAPFRTKRDRLGTLLSQRLTFRTLPRRRRCPLPVGVILFAEVTPLVAGGIEPMLRGLLELAAPLAAVALPSIIRRADVEPRQASPAPQLEDHQLAHPSRKDENWTATSGSTTVRTYCCPSNGRT